MSKIQIYWYKYRALTFAYCQKFLGFILHLPIPPKVSVGAFIEHEGKFLVVNLTYRKGYAFPGGMVEPNENLEEALVREIKEETGLDITNCRYYTSASDRQYGIGVLAVMYTADISGDIIPSSEGGVSFETPETILNQCAYQNWGIVFRKYISNYESPRY